MSIEVTPAIRLADDEIVVSFTRAPGPGGQNVNKVETAVQLRFDAAASPAIRPAVLQRLRVIAGQRMTKSGVVVIAAHRYRSQERNRADAIERLVDLIRRAAVTPKRRRPTKPSKAAKQRRLDKKKQRSDIKKGRGRVRDGD